MLNREHEKISDREVKNRGYQMRPIIFKATHTHRLKKHSKMLTEILSAETINNFYFLPGISYILQRTYFFGDKKGYLKMRGIR